MIDRQDVFTRSLIVVDADSVQLQVAVSMVGSSRVDAVLITDHLPELHSGHEVKYIECKQSVAVQQVRTLPVSL